MNDSQQLKRGQVAPFNPNPRWPTGYFQVLEELGVEERRRPFYAHWVRQFFNHQQERKQRRYLGRREIEEFIQALAAEDVRTWSQDFAAIAQQLTNELFAFHMAISLTSCSRGPPCWDTKSRCGAALAPVKLGAEQCLADESFHETVAPV